MNFIIDNTKSAFCKFGEKCVKGVDCTYAHNLDEFKPIVCLFDECKRPNCYRYHLLKESLVEYCQRMNIKIPFTDKVENKKEKIKLCRNMKENIPCAVKGCLFAHSILELNPVRCTKCGSRKSDICSYYHFGQDTVEYYKKFDPKTTIEKFMFDLPEKNVKVERTEEQLMDELRKLENERNDNDLCEELNLLQIQIPEKRKFEMIIDLKDSDDEESDEESEITVILN